MPWNKVELMAQRMDFIDKLLLPGVNVTEFCAKANISRKTAYKWLNRYRISGLEGLNDKKRIPHISPLKIDNQTEYLIIQTHEDHPYWGPRKLRHYLKNKKDSLEIPSASTFARVLKRNDCQVLTLQKSASAKIRFEKEQPNDLWQMDFKGSFLTQLERCHPLTILDDHSRYSIGLFACINEKQETVKKHLISCFRLYGKPKQINVDNGSPWGDSALKSDTWIVIWLLKHGVRVSHSSAYHPQTNGKDERFHRTLKLEVLHNRMYYSCMKLQETFDHWRHEYNYSRPHEALNGNVPSSRYKPSEEEYIEKEIDPEYDEGDIVRKVDTVNGIFRFKGRRFHGGKALQGERIALKETEETNKYSVFFMDYYIKTINLDEGV